MTIRKVKRKGGTRLVIDILYRKPDGARGRYRKDAQVQTMAAARTEERRLLSNIGQFGEPFEPIPQVELVALKEEMSISFKDVVDLFRKGKAITDLKPSTRIGYEEILTTRLIPKFGDRSLDGIGFEDASVLDAGMVLEGLSISRRRNVLVVLRSVLQAAVDLGKLKAMPALPQLPKLGKKSIGALTQKQVEAILAVSSASQKTAFSLAAYAGLRAGEVRALRGVDVDLDAGILVVRFSKSKGETSTPKSGHERMIPLAAPLKALLASTKKTSKLVALTEKGEQWGEWGLLQAFKRALKKAGLEGWTFHLLRHYFVSALFRGGASAPAVQLLAGHADLTTTQRYAHTAQRDLRATIALLDRGNQMVTT